MRPVIFVCVLFVVFFNGCTVINPIRKSPFNTFQKNVSQKPFDVIIVPGVPYNSDKWGKVMRYRILWAKFLVEKGYAKNIIFSGAAVHTPYVESKIMALYMEALGVPKQNIFTEEKAEHSTENVYYSYYLAKSKGFNNIALATDPYQTNNLTRFIMKNNFDIKILPIQFDSILIMKVKEPTIDPSSAYSNESFKALKQRESFFKRLRGTMGKNISDTLLDQKEKN